MQTLGQLSRLDVTEIMSQVLAVQQSFAVLFLNKNTESFHRESN